MERKKLRWSICFFSWPGSSSTKLNLKKKTNFLQNSAATWPRMRDTHRPQTWRSSSDHPAPNFSGEETIRTRRESGGLLMEKREWTKWWREGYQWDHTVWVTQRSLKLCWSGSKSFVVSLVCLKAKLKITHWLTQPDKTTGSQVAEYYTRKSF